MKNFTHGVLTFCAIFGAFHYGLLITNSAGIGMILSVIVLAVCFADFTARRS